jgi:1-deoxy-D-xylulose-5-phosphate synthase
MSLLEKIHGPADLKRLRRDQLPVLAEEIRQRLIDCCSVTGGHIGASLGVVELAIALLYEFDSPTDKILWDVGHQAYAWKLLTGRNEGFETLRSVGGISGFLKRDESEHGHRARPPRRETQGGGRGGRRRPDLRPLL